MAAPIYWPVKHYEEHRGWMARKKKRYLHAAEPESRCRAEYAEKRKKSGSLFYCKRVSPMNGFSANGKTVRGRREAGKRARKSLSRRRRSESVVANIDLRNKFSLDDVYHSVADCGWPWKQCELFSRYFMHTRHRHFRQQSAPLRLPMLSLFMPLTPAKDDRLV